MFCSNCGTRLQDGAKYCHNCGAPVISNATVEFDAVTSVPAPEIPEAPAASIYTPVFTDNKASGSFGDAADAVVSDIPEPSFAAPQYVPAEPDITQAPVMESVQNPYTASSVYTQATPFDQSAPAAADAPAEIGGEVPSYSSMYRTADTVVPEAAANASADTSPYSSDGAFRVPDAAAGGVPAQKKGRGRYILPIIVIFAILAGCWYWFFGGNDIGGGDVPVPAVTDPTELPEYTEALDAMENGDYEKAYGLLEPMYINYSSQEVADALLEAYRQKLLEAITENDFEQYEDVLKKAAAMIPDENAEVIYSAYYSEWLKALLRGDVQGDFDSVYERSERYLSDEDKETFDMVRNVAQTIAGYIADTIDADNNDGACIYTYKDSPMFQLLLVQHKEERFRIKIEGHQYSDVIFMRNDEQDCYYAYYGDVDEEGKRNGYGTMVSMLSETEAASEIYWYECSWIDDVPNGDFTEVYRRIGSDYKMLEGYAWRGRLKDGVYDGPFIEVHDDKTYVGEMENGKYSQTFGETDDMVAILIGAEDPNDKMYIPKEDLDKVYGVDFY